VEDGLAEEVLRGQFSDGGVIRIRKGEGTGLLFEVGETIEAAS
jgi:hypothetical protein